VDPDTSLHEGYWGQLTPLFGFYITQLKHNFTS